MFLLSYKCPKLITSTLSEEKKNPNYSQYTLRLFVYPNRARLLGH